MTEIYNIHETKTNLSKILSHVEAGETVLIARAGKPIATLAKYDAEKEEKPLKRREPGLLKGEIWLADDWDSPEVNEKIARMFYDALGVDYDSLPVTGESAQFLEAPKKDKKE